MTKPQLVSFIVAMNILDIIKHSVKAHAPSVVGSMERTKTPLLISLFGLCKVELGFSSSRAVRAFCFVYPRIR